MSFEKIPLPEENDLPLRVTKSARLAGGGESKVYNIDAKTSENETKSLALKESTKEEFVSQEKNLQAWKKKLEASI